MQSISRLTLRQFKQWGTSRSVQRTYLDWPLLKEEHVMIGQTCRNFADTELKPIAGKIDKEHWFPEPQIKKLGELGMMGICVPSEFGGSELDTMSYAIAMEEISRGCASAGVIMSANNSLYCYPVNAYGNQEQKEQFLKPWSVFCLFLNFLC